MRLAHWTLVAFAAQTIGCLPFGLGGEVDGNELSFVDVTYVELRGTDVATSTPFHDIEIWLMPMEDSCETFGPMIAALAELRDELTLGLSPETYCDRWETIYADHTGLEGFWVGHARLNALPRPDNVSPATTYDFMEEDAEGTLDTPSFDADLWWYPAPTFEACATEFSGDDFYGPTPFSAMGGTVTVRPYKEDESLSARFDTEFESDEGDPIRGKAAVEYCPAAIDWPTSFGRGL